MRAVVQDRYGADPDAVLAVAEVARPAIGDHDVLVRVSAAGVDIGTWHCMTGMPYAMRLTGFGLRSPNAMNPGRGLAGTVEAVGRSVTSFAPGNEVYGSCDGSFAEYASVPVDQLARKPWNLTFVQSAAVPVFRSYSSRYSTTASATEAAMAFWLLRVVRNRPSCGLVL